MVGAPLGSTSALATVLATAAATCCGSVAAELLGAFFASQRRVISAMDKAWDGKRMKLGQPGSP